MFNDYIIVMPYSIILIMSEKLRQSKQEDRDYLPIYRILDSPVHTLGKIWLSMHQFQKNHYS